MDGYSAGTTFLEAQRCVAIYSQIDVVMLFDGRAVASNNAPFPFAKLSESGFREIWTRFDYFS